MKTYSIPSNARRAAKKALGHTSFEVVKQVDGTYYWIDISEAANEAAAKENDPPEVVSYGEEADSILDPDPPEATEPEPEVEPEPEAEVEAEPEVEEDSLPAPAAKDTVALEDCGLTQDAEELILAMGEEIGESIAVPKRKPRLTTKAWKDAESGKLPDAPTFPASNSYARAHAEKMRDMAIAGDIDGIISYPIGGTNTYSKALRSFKGALLRYLGVDLMTEGPVAEAA